MSLLGSLAAIALILTAIGLMLSIVKPDDTLKHIGAILVIVIGLMMVPGILMSAWSAMSLIAPDRSHRDWDLRLSVATTATATTEKERGIEFPCNPARDSETVSIRPIEGTEHRTLYASCSSAYT